MEQTKVNGSGGPLAGKRAAQAQKNRDDYPETSALVDQLRRAFGPGVRVLHASECGHEIGDDLDSDSFVMPHVPVHADVGPRTASERKMARERAPKHSQHLV